MIEPKRMRGAPRPTRQFIDLTGKALAGCQVIRQLPDLGPKSFWLVTATCGHEISAYGHKLRAYERQGLKLRCGSCAQKRRAELNRQRAKNPKPETPYVKREKLPPRQRICRKCHGLAHRVSGLVCVCGLRRQDERLPDV